MTTQWPHDLRAERALLGGLMLDPAAMDQINIGSGVFHRPAHAKLYQAMRDMWEVEGFVEGPALFSRCPDWEDLPTLFLDVMNDATDSVRVPYWVEVVEEMASRRAKLTASLRLSEAISEGDAESIELAEKEVRESIDAPTCRRFVTRQEWHDECVDAYEQPQELGVTLPLKDLNRAFGGMQFGLNTVIGGRPTMGKTALALWFLLKAAKDGNPCLIISLEQPRQELRHRLMAMLPAMDWECRQIQMSHNQIVWKDLDHQTYRYLSDKLNELPIWIVDDTYDTAGILRASKHFVYRRGVRTVMLDYAQCVRNPAITGDGAKRLVMDDLCNRWYEMVKRHKVCGYLLSQLNREAEKGPKRRPRMSDSKESGSIEERADRFLIVHIEDQQNQWGEIIIEKDKITGQAGRSIRFTRDAGHMAFLDHERGREEC